MTRTYAGVSDLSRLRRAACARRSRGPKQIGGIWAKVGLAQVCLARLPEPLDRLAHSFQFLRRHQQPDRVPVARLRQPILIDVSRLARPPGAKVANPHVRDEEREVETEQGEGRRAPADERAGSGYASPNLPRNIPTS
jgi:hypothetical protein